MGYCGKKHQLKKNILMAEDYICKVNYASLNIPKIGYF